MKKYIVLLLLLITSIASAQEVRPKPHLRSPIKCAGPYVGMGDPKTDWNAIGKDLYDNGYNTISLFLSMDTPLHSNPLTLNYTVNPEWVQRNYEMMERMAWWRITPKIKFVDQYHEDPQDPIFKALGDDTEALYSSWDGSKYRWISWQEPTPHHYTDFKATSPFGRGMMNWIQAVVKNAEKINKLTLPNGNLKYPDFRIEIAWANETKAIFNEQGHPTKTVGDRDEILYWIQQLFGVAGFKMNQDLLVDVDYLAYSPSIKQVDYHTMAGVSQVLAKRGQRLEIHGIKTLQDCQAYINAGVISRSTLFSTDGDLRLIADMKGLCRSNLHTDVKVDVHPGQPYFPTNFMMFWQRTFRKEYTEFVKDKNQ